MRLVCNKEEKQKERGIYEASEYSECVIEYLDKEEDAERILIVKDDNLENIIVFWRSSVYIYPLCGRLPIQEVYEQIRIDFLMEEITDIYQVSSTVSFDRINK